MRKAANFTGFSVLLVLALLLSSISSVSIKPVSAHPGKLMWSIVDTPSPNNNVIVSPSEINVIAIGSDDRTFYAVDIPRSKIYKSTDAGASWMVELNLNLPADALPVWNLAVAPDDVNFLVAVTDATSPPSGPQRVFVSENGGANWQNTNFPALAVGGYIGCLDISIEYGSGNRDIAIGTRTGSGTGKVYALRSPSFSDWRDQTVPPSTTYWPGGDVIALKFPPTYTSDTSLVVVTADGTGTHINIGSRDTANNTTTWNAVGGYPLLIVGTTHLQIITADLELTSDFSGTDINLRRMYVSTDDAVLQSGVYRVDNTMVYAIRPPVTAPTVGRISSIAYFGNYAGGVLLAGEVTTDATTGMVYVWRTSDPTALTPTWLKSDTYKSPTGGGTSTYANAQIAWSPDGTMAYCGTSSACLGVYNTMAGLLDCAPPAWPKGYLNSVPLDESAFSASPYSPAYKQMLVVFQKTQDAVVGSVWNQLSLIDTKMGQTVALPDFLSDVAVLEAPETGEGGSNDYDVLYLASINSGGLDSVWRSTSDPLGMTWERILCMATSDNGMILRVRQPAYDEVDRSRVIVCADLGTGLVISSQDEGQIWVVSHLTNVTDLALAGDEVMYILSGAVVYRYEWSVNNWVRTHKENTELDAGHTIAVPLKNPEKKGDEETEDWVIVGEKAGFGRVAYGDFSKVPVEFEPPTNMRISLPIAGDVHVVADDKFEQNKIIYAATNDISGTAGKIYRWTIDKSTSWDELQPPNTAFYGLAQRNDVLYGAWNVAGPPRPPEPANNPPGLDRTLFPRKGVPPPPEWDDLTVGLPAPGNINFPVAFTSEPSSLKISSNEYNNLWAIDNSLIGYDWTTQIGCLWAYTDTAAKVGPWTTAPPSGSFIPVDPRSGRAVEVNFAWRQLSYSTVYELQLAKDVDFYNRVLVNENITPVDQLAPEVYLPAGALIPVSGSNIGSWGNLESGHTYYWRVRARAAVTGEIVRSPWSATMYFTVGAGLRTTSPYPTVTLFSPMYGAKNISTSPGFSWSGLPGTTKYEFILAKDSAFQKVVVKADVPTTSFLYDGKLDNNTSYFWHVRAIEPVVSDPSPIGTFTVVAEKKPVTPEVETPAPIPSWVWWIIAVFTALVVVIIAFTMVKPSYTRPGGGKLFKVEPIADKPEKPMVKPAGVKLDNLKPIVNKLKSRIAKIWESITRAVRRLRNFRKRGVGESENSESEVSKSEDSQNKLT
jgi:hypothetical protein